ncbi:MAG: HAD family hydrolase [Gammaproteobacteria bacterium]|nr:HAD family hydrolase [Gammaproteobacteria bacterium]MDE0251289.1 HAD family hydrolase [Gammaproteobacteria bacterium]MDE0402026.1 HAD family hydrolase [Gammaproteobacteria bacterium]
MQQTSFIFDLDGTIWDSRSWFIKAIRYLADDPLSDVTEGLLCETNYLKLAKSFGITNQHLVSGANRCEVGTVSLYDNVKPTLEELRARKLGLGVVSNLPGKLALVHLRATEILEYFKEDLIITPRRGIRSKPHPNGVLELLRRMEHNNSTARCWFVGDSSVDAIAANSAGVKFIWAAYGYEKQAPPKTHQVISEFKELLEL